ncbi:MAG: demethoxyubiquinone hydroxylase family protein [Chloroflexota bacterium]|nr:demethoxyubiquinone hydroxylase family protein [Chloroflexota bacterium]
MKEVLHSLGVMYNIERAATAIYRAQVWAFRGTEIADKLGAATANEREHADGLKLRIEELGGSAPRLGFIFALGGSLVGFAATLPGRMRVLKTDGWVERKAVKDYSSFLDRIDYDEKSAALIRKNIEDEKMHIRNWAESIELLKNRKRK